MAADILLGLQWGDEGKGKIVDVLSANYDLIARFQGGPNAGHTLVFEGQKFVLNTLPSGIFLDGVMNLIGNGVVIDPIALKGEIIRLRDAGYDLLGKGNLLIAKRAHLILPTHKLLDAAMEKAMGDDKIGTTGKGIGPAYTDKTGRKGLRMGDKDLTEKYRKLADEHIDLLHKQYGITATPDDAAFFEAIAFLHQFPLVDAERVVNDYLQKGKKVLAEGAQGSLLDVDFGSYPYVTSSNTTSAGACSGLGIAPQQIGEVIGIMKAYCTRVGGGPFPTEQENEMGELLRHKGQEFGAVSGRPRRTGWLDLPALRYAIMLNGVTQLVITKADVLTGIDQLLVCTHYEEGDYLPYNHTGTPVYKAFEGWQEDQEENLWVYIRFIEAALGVPVKYLSVGPDRKQTIFLN